MLGKEDGECRRDVLANAIPTLVPRRREHEPAMTDHSARASAGDGLLKGLDGRLRCWWQSGDPIYQLYHDEEWGRPIAEDARLFEKVCVEGFQVGLSWLTILRKRENFRRAFAGFDPRGLADFGEAEIARLLADSGIVRHRGKIESVVNNARRALVLQEEAGSLAAFIWRFEPGAGGRPASNAERSPQWRARHPRSRSPRL